MPWRWPGSRRRRLAQTDWGDGGRQLIDALVLEDPTLQERFAGLVRRHGLVSQASGIDVATSSAGLLAKANQAVDAYAAAVTLAADGAMVVDTQARAEGGMGMMALSLPKIEAFIAAASAFAQDTWELLPDSHRIRQVAACVGIPQPSMQALSISGQVGNSMRMPQIPGSLVAPQPAAILRRADVGAARSNQLLAVSLKRAFADHDALADETPRTGASAPSRSSPLAPDLSALPPQTASPRSSEIADFF